MRARSLINRVPAASAMPFGWTINPYRGCSHACVYCFARPTHEYLGFDIGEDFDRRIVIKVNAVERLRAELRAPRWAGEEIAMGTNTDPYQPVEGRYRLTRGIVEALAEARNPFSILTKSTLIGRDADVLGDAARESDVGTALSVGCLDEDVWRAVEPHTPNPMRRIETVAKLAEAGVACGVMVAPILPGISDAPEQLEAVVRAAIEAGATSVTPIALHLRPGVREHYLSWIERAARSCCPRCAGATAPRTAPEESRRPSAGWWRIVARHGGARGPCPAASRAGGRPPAGSVVADVALMSMHAHANACPMLTRRLQVLLDEDRYFRLASEADRRSVPVAVVVREAIDAAFPSGADERAAAARAILDAPAMPVPDPVALKAELDEIRSRRR